ncbi:glutathione hydrolase 1 proenzyme isoform X2 [Drosophila busckii]|uniref:glutathione hydrolase 1 proenzyme isoform X2 n=1 Tax=Drosophila busckii TaxID=30019 RepID=UPI00083F1D76|nr:glutathione hydrolase 1 proenzyme isoform X2 [Drosophila busckii]
MHWQCIYSLALMCIPIGIYIVKQNTVKTVPDAKYELPPSSSKLHRFKDAGICSDSEDCSAVAKKILLADGNVVDAALAALLCNGLIGMQSMGLGGGFLMNIYMHKERKSYSILSREFAPLMLLESNFTNFRTEQQLRQSSWSIAVPTELVGYALAHERFGELPWAQLVQPTLDLCRQGYKLYKHQYDALLLNAIMIKNDDLLRKMFTDENTGKFKRLGSHIQPPKQLCATYEVLAREGPRSFYNGTLSIKLLDDLADMGSNINTMDLKLAQAELVESIVLPLDEYELHLTPPPGSGHIVGLIMNILHEFKADFAAESKLNATQLHRIVEALKFGFVQRWRLDDRADETLLKRLLSEGFARNLAQQIDDGQTFNESIHYGAPDDLEVRQEQGTAHMSLLHKQNAVSVTSSINFYFGSGRMGKRTGVLFNNAMSDFSMQHLRNYFELPYVEGKNTIATAARPMSSMSPIIVTDRRSGQVRLVVGAAGGTKIISALVPLLVRLLWQQAHIKHAIDASRIHHQMLPNVVQYEYGLLEKQLKQLREKGHRCERYRQRNSVICGVAWRNETVFVNSDYRKIGGVAGF